MSPRTNSEAPSILLLRTQEFLFRWIFSDILLLRLKPTLQSAQCVCSLHNAMTERCYAAQTVADVMPIKMAFLSYLVYIYYFLSFVIIVGRHEIHLECVRYPELFVPPTGDFYCPTCAENDSTFRLRKYVQNHNLQVKNSNHSSIDEYNLWLSAHQRHLKFEDWLSSPLFSSILSSPSSPYRSILSHFNYCPQDVIGSKIVLFIPSISPVVISSPMLMEPFTNTVPNPAEAHTGRIVNCRQNILGYWEHLCLFRQGGNDRRTEYQDWITLDEFPCCVSREIVIYRETQVAQVWFRSGMEVHSIYSNYN
jgi:hypothetical protein